MRFLYFLLLVNCKPEYGKMLTRKYMKESKIYNIKLPPEPYKFLEGVGYMSGVREGLLARSGLQSFIQQLKVNSNKNSNVLKIPTSFLLNGKPFGVSTDMENHNMSTTQLPGNQPRPINVKTEKEKISDKSNTAKIVTTEVTPDSNLQSVVEISSKSTTEKQEFLFTESEPIGSQTTMNESQTTNHNYHVASQTANPPPPLVPKDEIIKSPNDNVPKIPSQSFQFPNQIKSYVENSAPHKPFFIVPASTTLLKYPNQIPYPNLSYNQIPLSLSYPFNSFPLPPQSSLLYQHPSYHYNMFTIQN